MRRRVFYSGHVQGVGFRFTVERIAQQYAVAGWVRNLLDGRVELLAEGASDQLDPFLARVAQVMASHIHSADQREEPPTGEFRDFSIAR